MEHDLEQPDPLKDLASCIYGPSKVSVKDKNKIKVLMNRN